MRYFVLGEDGQTYGPADLATLNQWVLEGRIVPTTLLQPEGTQRRMAASTVPGLVFQQGHTYNSYTPQIADGGQSEIKAAWIALVLSFVCCGCINHVGTVASGFSIFLGYLGFKKGNSSALIIMILGSLSLAFHLYITFNPIGGDSISRLQELFNKQ